MALKKLKPKYKFWLETEDGYIFGRGAFELLQEIQRTGSLSAAARELGMSYRYAWGIIKQIESRVEEPVLKTYKGGRYGGGGADLTPKGQELLDTYFQFQQAQSKYKESSFCFATLLKNSSN